MIEAQVGRHVYDPCSVDFAKGDIVVKCFNCGKLESLLTMGIVLDDIGLGSQRKLRLICMRIFIKTL